MSKEPTKLTISHDGNTVETTLEEIQAMAKSDQFDGMPEEQAKVIHKVTGVYAEEYNNEVTKVGTEIEVTLTVAVKSVTKQRDKDGKIEYVVVWKAIE